MVALRKLHGVSSVRQVLGVDIVVLTGKNQNRSSFSQEAKVIGRGNVYEELLQEDLCEWILIIGVRSEDEISTRYCRGVGSWSDNEYRRVITAKDLCLVIKDACLEFGFDPKNFAPKSLRKGFATHMTTCGISSEDMVARAVSSLRSRVPEGHYIRSFARGAFSAALDVDNQVAGLGPEGTRRLLPPSGAVSVAR